jgi:hypothetical protein
VRFNISGIGLLPLDEEPLVATRLFHRQQPLNLTALTEGNDTVFTFTDFIDSQVPNIYRIGCDVRKFTLPSPPSQPNPTAHETGQSFNYIVGNGDLEADSVDDVLAPGGARPGYSVRRVDWAGAGTPPATDDRARVNTDTADPHGGRYSAKINLGGGPRAQTGGLGIQVTIPVNKTIPPQPTVSRFQVKKVIHLYTFTNLCLPLCVLGFYSPGTIGRLRFQLDALGALLSSRCATKCASGSWRNHQ